MQNKVTVTINDQAYTLVATEDAAYMEKVAAHVDAKIGEIRAGGKISIQDAAVLAALNVADEYFKGQEAAEALRRQYAIFQTTSEASRNALEIHLHIIEELHKRAGGGELPHQDAPPMKADFRA